MRVLFVNHTSAISGGELSLLTLLRALPHEVEPIVACPAGPLAERVSSIGIETHAISGTDGSLRLHPARTARAIGQLARTALEVGRLAGDTGADLLHANSIRAGLVVEGARRGGSTPTIIQIRDRIPPTPASKAPKRPWR